MTEKKETAKKRCYDYPEGTVGGKGAREAQALVNNLSEEEIDEMYESEKKIVYGGLRS